MKTIKQLKALYKQETDKDCEDIKILKGFYEKYLGLPEIIYANKMGITIRNAREILNEKVLE